MTTTQDDKRTLYLKVRLSPMEYQVVKAMADGDDRTVSQIVRLALKELYERRTA